MPTTQSSAATIMQIVITQVAAEQVWAIRHRSLRIGQPLGTERMPGIDEHPDTINLLLTAEGNGVGCATFMPEQNGPSKWRLRGMAIDQSHRRHGLGKRLVDYFVEIHGDSIWCNARTSALEFYQSCGFTAEGNEFDVAPIGPHYVMRIVSE